MNSSGGLHVLAISGSLRKGSYNTLALRAARELAPADMKIELFDIAAIPMYNADLDVDPRPKPVQRLKSAIAKADALLIATPEYNYSIPGVLKNAIDWASRPGGKSPLVGKPTAIMGVTTGLFGTVRAQAHLRQIFVYNDMPTVNQPQVLIMKAQDKFDASGHLIDEESRGFIRQLLENLALLTRRMQYKPEVRAQAESA